MTETAQTGTKRTGNRRPGCSFNAENVRRYYAEKEEYPVPTAEQEKILLRRIREGDQEARERMIISNIPLVVDLAKRYVSRCNHLDDLVQDGIIGLITAIDRFEESMQTRFSTYATYWINIEIDKGAKDREKCIKVPYIVEQLFRKAAANIDRDEMEVEDVIKKIAEGMNMKESGALSVMNALAEPVCLDNPVRAGEDSGGRLLYIQTAVEGEEQIIEEITKKEMSELLNRNMYLLSMRQRAAVVLYYGMEDGIERTLEEVGYELNCNRERVRQLICDAQKILAASLSETNTEEERDMLNRILENKRITQIKTF